ncbi:hypothetical protein [Hyphobacterium sp.]|uniref:hypothetical protein n=1 Tax=Hyphobacterium sp. TaxID=2004662 RepID=UPI003B51A3CD
MLRPDRLAVHAAIVAKGHVLFANPAGFDLNIIAIRSRSARAGRFDDWLTVSYVDAPDNAWVFHAFACTTDPGLTHLATPRHRDGTAILKAGQYRASHEIARHRGRYLALCQRPGARLSVHRDRNRDRRLDRRPDRVFDNATGINIHRASATRRSHRVGRWSAGCIVVADPTDFAVLMTLAHRAKQIYGNAFTLTLLDEADL